MPVSTSLNDRINAEVGDWEPSRVPLAESTTPVAGGGSAGDVGDDLAARFKKGMRGGDELIKAGLYAVAGPLIPETGKAGEIAGRIMRPVFDNDQKAIDDRSKNPRTFTGKILGGAAEGVGAMATMPMAGGVARNIVAAVGMGEGAEISKNVFGGLFSYFGGEKYRATGEATGEILGGGVGSQANVTRMKAMGEAASSVFSAAKSIKPAYDSARAKQVAGDTRSLWPIFADEFGALRAKTNGLIQEYTNRQVAGLIRQDYRASEVAEEFDKDAKVTGIETKDWGLGERTMVPQIAETVARAKPGSAKEASEMAARAQGMKLSIGKVYDKVVEGAKIPADAAGIEASAKVFRNMTQKKVDALSTETGEVIAAFPALNATQEHAVGEATRAIRDKLTGQSMDIARGKYTEAFTRADADGMGIDIGDTREGSKEVLGSFYHNLDPAKIPSVVKNLLDATAVEGEKGAESAGRLLSLKDANDLSRALGDAATEALQAENRQGYRVAKDLESRVQAAIDGSKASPETIAAYREARRYWSEEHAPRFNEGLGKALGRERSGVFEGREAIKSEKVMDDVLSGETGMRDFDRTFGKDPQARQLLNAALQDKFRKGVMDRPYTENGFEANVRDFKNKYASALDRLPEVETKIDQQAAKMVTLQAEKKAELTRYKSIMGSDVSSAIGPVQAKEMFQAALADPLKMEALLKVTPAKDLVKEVFEQANPFKAGEYDPDALLKLVQAGKRNAESPSTMEMLFAKAFGDKEGRRHLDTLEAISRFTKRQALTDPKYLQAGSILNDSPVKAASGAGMASWINDYRAVATGRTGANYTAYLGLSRFVNAKVQNAIESAKRRALYDPATADAILEMSATPSSQPLSLTTARNIFGEIKTGNGQKLVDRLVDKGYVKAYVSRGIIYGTEKAMQDAEDPNSRQNLRRGAQ